jgi:hypothetical protein
MAWLDDFWATFKGDKPKDRLLLPNLVIANEPAIGQDIVEDECYLELFVESYRPYKARSFATTFNGIVYSSITMSRLGDDDLQLTAVSKPKFLSTLDSNVVDVITVSRKMIGPVAWRGGGLHLELGLFSVKTGNILTPAIDLVTEISSVAGIGFAATAKPFIPLMTKGLDLIAGQTKDTAIEIAIDTDLDPKKTAAFAIIDAPKTSVDTSKVTVDDTDRKLLLDGRPLEYGYCVFSIRKSDKKADFGQIPELKAKFAAFQRCLSENKKSDAADALTAFRLAALASPDLITKDAKGLAAKAQETFDAAFPGGLVIKNLVARKPQELADIGLYD